MSDMENYTASTHKEIIYSLMFQRHVQWQAAWILYNSQGLFYMYESRQFSYYPFNLIYFNVSKYMCLANVESLKVTFIIFSATYFLFMHNFVSQH